MADPRWGEADARDALAVEFARLLAVADRGGDTVDGLAVRLANLALSVGWQPSEWTRAVGRLSTAFGETGAPWASICDTDCTHDTCTAVRGLVGLFTGWLPSPARGDHRG